MKMDNPLLQITIDNKEDIELFELASSMTSISDQYHRYLRQSKRERVKSQSKLYVKEIKRGSIILDLCEKAPETFIGIEPIIVGYAGFLVNTLNYLTGRVPKLPEIYKFLKEDFTNFKKLLEPIANVSGNYLTLNVNFGTVVYNQSYNSIDANAAQNRCDKEIKLLEKAGDSLFKEKVNLKLYQARNSNLSKSMSGNMGIISELSEEPKILSFITQKLRSEIIHGEENPYNYTYNVDVEIQLKEGSSYFGSHKDIKEYSVLKLNGIVENTDLLSN